MASGDRGRLDELQEEKSRLLAQRDQLLADLQDVDNRISQVSTEYGRIHNEALLINKIPDEILHTILKALKSSLTAKYRAEVPFSAVCSRWRRATLSFRDIWSNFRTALSSPSTHQLFIACLERSGTNPLDLWFDFREYGYGDLGDGFLLLQDALKNIHRWRSFTLISVVQTPVEYLAKRIKKAEAPLLERLTIMSQPSYVFNPLAEPVSNRQNGAPTAFIGGAPRLEYVCLSNLSVTTCLPPLSSITDLRLDLPEKIEADWIPFDVFLSALRLPHLTTLSLIGQPFPLLEGGVANGLTIDMPSLKHFRHATREHSDFSKFILPNIRAPKLATLTLKHFRNPTVVTHWAPSNVVPFPALKTLTLIEYNKYHSPFSLKLAELTSNISTLVVSDRDMHFGRKGRVQGNDQDSFTVGWKGIRRLALNTYQLRETLCDFIQTRPKLQVLLIPNTWTPKWLNNHDWLEGGRKLKVWEWIARAEADKSLGPWPPGSPNDNLVDDPFHFRLSMS